MRGSVRSAKWWAMESSWSAVMVILLGASVIEEEDYQKLGSSTTFRRHIRVSSWCSDPGRSPRRLRAAGDR